MSLPPERKQKSFLDVAFVAQELFEEQSPYRLFREKVLPALEGARDQFAQLYCADKGRPALEPVVLAGTLLLQFMEKMPDRKAVSCLKLHLGWKYALDLQWDNTGFHPTSLVVFRRRLVEGGLERVVFDSVVQTLQEEGLVAKRGKQRIDSTHVVGCVRAMSRLERVRETVRLFLRDVEAQDLEEKPPQWTRLQERYCESEVDFRELTKEKTITQLQRAGQDILGLIQWLEQQSPEFRQRDQSQLLKRVFDEQFEVVKEKVQQHAPELAGSVQNPHDPDAQWAAKDPTWASRWVGYKVQVMETVSEDSQARSQGEPTEQFLTEMMTTEAIATDLDGMGRALEAQRQHGGREPRELYADAAYVSTEELARAQKEGRQLIGPARRGPGRGSIFRAAQFDVDLEQLTAVCPAGQTSTRCQRIHDSSGRLSLYRFAWGAQCETCRLRKKCTTIPRRTLTVGRHYDLLQKRRREMKTEAFQKRYQQRNAIEGTNSELVRGYGMRTTRYRGLAKTRLANYFIGAACNVNRWARLHAWQLEQAEKAA